MQRRMAELAAERDISALPPVVLAGALVVPLGLLQQLGVVDDQQAAEPEVDPARRAEIERLAMEAVMVAERALGFEPRDVSRDNCGYDIESRQPNGTGHLRFVEVKGIGPGNDRVTITRNELLRARNSAEWHRLAIVQVEGDTPGSPGTSPGTTLVKWASQRSVECSAWASCWRSHANRIDRFKLCPEHCRGKTELGKERAAATRPAVRQSAGWAN
jgi:Domain of unknown function (DUF3883)